MECNQAEYKQGVVTHVANVKDDTEVDARAAHVKGDTNVVVHVAHVCLSEVGDTNAVANATYVEDKCIVNAWLEVLPGH